LLVIAIGNRLIEDLVIGWGVTRDPCARDASWLYVIRDLLGFFVWCASYVGKRAVWRNIPYKLVGGGRIATRGDLPESETQK
jgi:hypothetical protein